MKVTKVRVFSSYTVDVDKKKKKEEVLHKLRQDLLSNIFAEDSVSVWYIVTISDIKVHNHVVGRTSMTHLNIHPSLVDKIHMLVQSGTSNIRDIKLQLQEHIQEISDATSRPDRMNRAFYPPDSVIYSHIRKASSLQKRIQQVVLSDHDYDFANEGNQNELVHVHVSLLAETNLQPFADKTNRNIDGSELLQHNNVIALDQKRQKVRKMCHSIVDESLDCDDEETLDVVIEQLEVAAEAMQKAKT